MPEQTAEIEITPVPTYKQGNAFEVTTGGGTKNTDSAGGIIMIIICVLALGIVIETVISHIIKAKKRSDEVWGSSHLTDEEKDKRDGKH